MWLSLAAFHWEVFRDLVLHPSHPWLVGLWTTVYVSVLAQALGVALGLVVELVRRSRRGALRAAAGVYVWLLRGTPLLVQLVIVYNGLAALGRLPVPRHHSARAHAARGDPGRAS